MVADPQSLERQPGVAVVPKSRMLSLFAVPGGFFEEMLGDLALLRLIPFASPRLARGDVGDRLALSGVGRRVPAFLLACTA